MRPPGKVHYLPGNKITWSPPTVVFIKAITRTSRTGTGEVLTLSGWVARIVQRAKIKPGAVTSRTSHGYTQRELAEWLVEHTKGRETTWVFTHNASLDLITTRLPLTLHRQGYDVTEASLSGSAPWVRLVKGSKRIAIADSFSWLPHTASDLAERTGEPPDPRQPTDSDASWAVRSAKHDLRVVSNAMLELMDWWDKHALGKWSISGPSTGWHAMRHLPNPHKVVIDPDPARIAQDRRAIYGGRRGAWIVGTRSNGPFLELDFANAYPSVARDLPLPSRRTAPFDSMALDNWRLTSDRWGIIANVQIRTPVPRWPVRFPGGTFTPVGEFTTTLAGPEIRDALRLECLLAVHAGITHQLGWHMQPWGEWIIDQVRNTAGDVPIPAQLFSKHMSRAVIGKWSSRAYERNDLGFTPERGWGYDEGWDHDSGTRFGIISLAGQRWESVVNGDAEQAYPGVFAWVESETRVRLTRTIEAVGERAVLQCNTDGLIVVERILGTRAAGGHLVAPAGLTGAARTKWVLDQLDPIIAPLTIRIKGTQRSVRILGPQHIQKGDRRSFAGIPALAREAAPDVFTYNSWPGIGYQLAHSDQGGYVRPDTTVTLHGSYAPGWVLTDGRVIPPECVIADDGSNRILGFDAMTLKPKGAKRADTQHPTLARLW